MDQPTPVHAKQPDSYTSSLIPESAEQSSPMSDFTSEMEPFLRLHPASKEQHEAPRETGSLLKSPIHTAQSHSRQGMQKKNHQELCPVPAPLNSSKSANTSAPMYQTQRTATTTTSNVAVRPRTEHMWQTPPPGDDQDQYSYGDSPACGSGRSSTGYSLDSPVGTWSSPATSFQHQHIESLPRDTWGDGHIATPISMDGFSGPRSEVSTTCDERIPEGFALNNAEWQNCEPLSENLLPDLAGLANVSCAPSAPDDGMMHVRSPFYKANINMASNKGVLEEADMVNLRASEPSMKDNPATPITAEQHIPYARLIYQALMEQEDHCMSLQDLYIWFEEKTNKCKPGEKGWKNSIRHNLSMNAGFTKRDRKSTGDSSCPAELDDAQSSSGDLKKSTDWTLTDEAIAKGIQSTTRYRNKKSARKTSSHRESTEDAWSRQHMGSLNSALGQQGMPSAAQGNMFRQHRNHVKSGRVSRQGRQAAQQYLRLGPTLHYLGRELPLTNSTSTTTSYHSHDAMMPQAVTEQSQQVPSVKMEPGLSPNYPPPPGGSAGPGPYKYGVSTMAVPHAVMGAGVGTPFDISSGGVAASPICLAAMADPSAAPPPTRSPSSHPVPFPYDGQQLDYSSLEGTPAPIFDTTDMTSGFYDWYSNQGY